MSMNATTRSFGYSAEVINTSLDLLFYERPLIERGEVVVGIDEVGRGALAGPLTVGAVAITKIDLVPTGLTDSKALTPSRRAALIGPLEEWCTDWSLGSVSAEEIDLWGLRLALAVAANRALTGLQVVPTHALIDGPLNLLHAPNAFNFAGATFPPLAFANIEQTRIVSGDRLSAVIAAASVMAKVHRDRKMTELAREFPHFGWDSNKGYGAPHHLQALLDYGPCSYHRQTWRLPSK
jgi:ribonuclease HII